MQTAPLRSQTIRRPTTASLPSSSARTPRSARLYLEALESCSGSQTQTHGGHQQRTQTRQTTRATARRVIRVVTVVPARRVRIVLHRTPPAPLTVHAQAHTALERYLEPSWEMAILEAATTTPQAHISGRDHATHTTPQSYVDQLMRARATTTATPTHVTVRLVQPRTITCVYSNLYLER